MAQTLAGRTAILRLLPLSMDELRRFPNPPSDLFPTLLAGGFPRIHDRGLTADRWLGDYVQTCLERDIRRLLAVGDLEAFTLFMRLLAGHTACELNLSSLGADVGVSHTTIRAWLSVLEASLPEAFGEAASARGVLVYGGRERQRRSDVDVVPWHEVTAVDWFA